MLLRFIFAIALLCASSASADTNTTRWVSDQLRISMRSGPADSFEILRILPTGTELQTERLEGDWAEVQLDDGARGWVVSRYLEAAPPARIELPDLRQALAQAEGRVAELEATVTRAEASLAELEALRSRAEELEVSKIQLESTAAATMMTIGGVIALAGFLVGALWPRRQSSRGIAIPPRYFRS